MADIKMPLIEIPGLGGPVVYLEDAEAAIQAAVAAEREARFLIVAMEDDGCGTPVYCKDEAAVKAALQPMLFYYPPGEELSDVHAQELDAQVATLLEDGELRFEGDPPIHLYRLQAIRARGAAHD